MNRLVLLLVVLFLPFSLLSQPRADTRQLAVPEEEMVAVEIATLAVSAFGAPVVLLREPGARRVVPIVIGAHEAAAILRAREEIRTPRPLTHDLFGPVFSTLNATLERIFIDELANDTFFGALELTVEGETHLVDCRPSDAMAIAIRLGAAIMVSPKVLEAASGIEYRGLEDEPVTAIGITVDTLTLELRQALGLEADRKGLLVTGVRGPAREQGLAPGDLVLAVNGRVPETPLDFLEGIRNTPEGEKAVIEYWQGGEEKQMKVSTDVPERRPQTTLKREGGISL